MPVGRWRRTGPLGWQPASESDGCGAAPALVLVSQWAEVAVGTRSSSYQNLTGNLSGMARAAYDLPQTRRPE